MTEAEQNAAKCRGKVTVTLGEVTISSNFDSGTRRVLISTHHLQNEPNKAKKHRTVRHKCFICNTACLYTPAHAHVDLMGLFRSGGILWLHSHNYVLGALWIPRG